MKMGSSRAVGALVVGALCLTACSEAPRKLPARPSAPAGSATGKVTPKPVVDDIVLVDARPAKDKVYSVHSLWITNCNYGIYTVGDAKLLSPVDALRADLAGIEGSPIKHRIRVDRYAVYYNPSRKFKRGAVGALGGLVGEIIASETTDFRKGSSCPAGKVDEGGWYGPGELTTNFAPLIVEMSGTFDEKHFVRRLVYSPRQEVNVKLKKPADVAEYQAAVHKANQELFAALGVSKVVVPAMSPPVQTPPAESPAAPADDEGWINFPSSGSK